MCGIAGAIDLTGQRTVSTEVLHAMANAIRHRGPDEDGYLRQDCISLASRRLTILDFHSGQQPITNEDQSVAVVYNGELFDYQQRKKELEHKGHRFRTQSDTEIIPHAWEEYGTDFFERLQGQFAFALWDQRQRRLILARDRFGICPLYWTRQGDWLLFASEIKALIASGMVAVRPEVNGINHLFSFFAMPGPVTMFEGISLLSPGQYLDIRPATGEHASSSFSIQQKTYWEMDFPEQGQERSEKRESVLVNEFEEILLAAVEKRLHADVPVVSYLSGGVDSSIVVAMANKILGYPIPTFTIRIDDPKLDETSEAAIVAKHVGSDPFVVNCGADEVLNNYPRLVESAESPVIDTSCAALLLLAERVNQEGYKVALTGEGADEWLAGYPWFKLTKLVGFLDVIPGLNVSMWLRRVSMQLSGLPPIPMDRVKAIQQHVGGHNAWLDIYGITALSKLRFFNQRLQEVVNDKIPYFELPLNTERLKSWHPLNRSLYFGASVHLPGLLMHAKGDRIAMRSSVETRYPFLDEKVFKFLADLHPHWKMHGFRDKVILRRLAERWLPKKIAHRRKAMFRAPLDSFHIDNPPAYVDQLFSRESLLKADYFDPDAVQQYRKVFRKLSYHSPQRLSVEMGLSGVLSTQLWHHLFIDPTLADLPGLTLQQQPAIV